MNTLTLEKRILSVLTILSLLFVTVMSFSTPQRVRAGTVCSPATAITSPYTKDGTGDVCLQATTLCTYINSWNLTTLEVNGTAYTNLYTVSSSIAPLNGGYTIHYSSTTSYGHFEMGGTCSSGPTNTPTSTPTATAAAPAPSPTATTQGSSQNPVHQYTFDGNANDTGSGSAANGTVTGGTYVSGRIGQASSLSGSSQYVSFPSGFVSTLGNFSVATWVYLNSASNWSRIFDFGTGTSVYMFLSPQNGSTNVVRFALTTAGNSSEQRIDGSAALPTGVWTHVVVTKSGNTGTLYVNGAVVGTNANMTLSPSSLGNTNQNWIGRSQFSADPYLNGRVDDFRIYNRALSASEVSSLASSGSGSTSGVVNTYGRLQISGTALRDKNGNAIQLAGMSSHGLTWFPLSDLNLNTTSNMNLLNQQITFNPAGGTPFPYTSSAVGNLVNQWHIQVIRASMFTYDPWNGADAKSYDNNYPTWKWYNINLVNTIVQSAINNNIYVVIDWHAGEGNDQDPTVYWNNGHVQEFFTYMVDKWGSYPNVIYETVNSPVIGWTSGLKTYNQNVIDLIRARETTDGYAPNLILAGTPTWSQDIDVASASPLTGNLIAYNYMWYAGTHFSWVQSRGDTALANLAANAPNQTVFMGEVGTSTSDGSGGVYYSNFNTLMEWAKTRKLSWLNWSLANKEESSAVFVKAIAGNMINNEIAWRGGNGTIAEALASTGYPMRMGPWTSADYSCSGKFILGWLLYNTSQSVPSGC